MLLILLFLCSHIVLSDIEWFKQTQTHQQNIVQLSNGWVNCPGWSPTSEVPTQIRLETIFSTVTTIRLPPIKNDIYNFTAQCITVQVPLNWEDESSTNTIDYHLAHIFASDNVDNTKENGAFWILNGGPGSDGQQLYLAAIPWLTYMDATYDVYIPDHRGTGYSNPIQCPTVDLQGCINFINDTYGNDINYFSTYAASMDLGYTIDLFINNLTHYVDNDTIIYGISYGTYYLNTYLNLFEDQATAVILDGICPPDICRIIDYDNNANIVGINFINLCGQDEFCRKQFVDDDPYESMQQLFNMINNGESCIDINVNGELLPVAPVLKQTFFSLLTDFYTRILIPAMLYRMDRCNDNDKKALNNLVNILLSNVTGNVTGNMAIGQNIILSELWNGLNPNDPGKNLSQLLDEENGYYVSSGISVTYRVWWDIWNRYTPNEQVYGKFANASVPMLLLNGNLDPQTPDTWAIHSARQYNANINDGSVPNELNRYYYTVPNTPHFVMFQSPIINSTQDSEITGDNIETCGFWIMKSFINRDNNWIPDDKCINWIEAIDWRGNNNISKLITMQLFGTDDLWEIEDDDSDHDNETAVIWIIVIGSIVIIVEMALFSYCDYKKEKITPHGDMDPLLDTTKVSGTERI